MLLIGVYAKSAPHTIPLPGGTGSWEGSRYGPEELGRTEMKSAAVPGVRWLGKFLGWVICVLKHGKNRASEGLEGLGGL